MIKRTLILTLLVFVYCYGNAQKLNYGLESGYLYNNLSVYEYSSSGRNGFKIGGLIGLSLKNKIALESGAQYVRKGGETYGSYLLGTPISKIKYSSMDYIQIPIAIGYIFDFDRNFHLKPQIGGYYAVGIGGDSFITGIDAYGQPYESRVSTFSSGYDKPYRPCNRNDAGFSFAIELSYQHVGLKLNYDMALTNATYYGNGRHRTLSASVFYWIK